RPEPPPPPRPSPPPPPRTEPPPPEPPPPPRTEPPPSAPEPDTSKREPEPSVVQNQEVKFQTSSQVPSNGPEAAQEPVSGDTNHKYSSSQFNLPEQVSAPLQAFGASIPKGKLAADGVEPESHIT